MASGGSDHRQLCGSIDVHYSRDLFHFISFVRLVHTPYLSVSRVAIIRILLTYRPTYRYLYPKPWATSQLSDTVFGRIINFDETSTLSTSCRSPQTCDNATYRQPCVAGTICFRSQSRTFKAHRLSDLKNLKQSKCFNSHLAIDIQMYSREYPPRSKLLCGSWSYVDGLGMNKI
jgi:hypothetical protein